MIPKNQKALSKTKRIWNRKNHELEKKHGTLKIPKLKNNFKTNENFLSKAYYQKLELLLIMIMIISYC